MDDWLLLVAVLRKLTADGQLNPLYVPLSARV
jgi:predicted small lipoprotein YifL